MKFHTRRKLLGLCLFSLTLIFAGCMDSEPETVVQENGEVWPAVLKYAYTPSQENPEGRLARFTELAAYLTEQIGVEVELIRSSSYGPTIEAMRADKVDIASGGSFTYMIAHEKADAEAIATRGTLSGERQTYDSIIATSPKTGIKTIEELIEGAENYSLAFTDAASTSGHLVPRGGLEGMGVVPEEAFKEVVFAQSHLNVVMATVAAKVDAGAMSGSTYDRFVREGRIQEDDLVVLWKSEEIPQSPIYVRRELPEGLKAAIRDAYVNMHVNDPDLMQSFRERAMRPNLVYIPATDDMWDELREVAYGLKSMKLLSGEK
ncbi:MAG: phosphate/phosphite/phosphonate ABC transporter substrate-binding protein [Opitutales bacterium]